MGLRPSGVQDAASIHTTLFGRIIPVSKLKFTVASHESAHPASQSRTRPNDTTAESWAKRVVRAGSSVSRLCSRLTHHRQIPSPSHETSRRVHAGRVRHRGGRAVIESGSGNSDRCELGILEEGRGLGNGQGLTGDWKRWTAPRRGLGRFLSPEHRRTRRHMV